MNNLLIINEDIENWAIFKKKLNNSKYFTRNWKEDGIGLGLWMKGLTLEENEGGEEGVE